MRGREITVSDVVIVEVSGLLVEGSVWVHKRLKLHGSMENFRDKVQELIKKGKGIRPYSLREPWGELARIVQNYITCDGYRDVVRPRQLKLLAVLKQKCFVNFLTLLNSLLHDTA